MGMLAAFVYKVLLKHSILWTSSIDVQSFPIWSLCVPRRHKDQETQRELIHAYVFVDLKK